MKALLALSGLFCLASSCAISMKMPANQFESSEVYGKTGLRAGLSYRGQSNVELTPNQTLQAPDTETPVIGPTHVLGANAGVGIGERVEVTYTLLDLLTGKVQLLGDSKQTATAGNISLSIAGTIGGLKNTEEDTAWFSTRRYRTEMHRTVYGVLVVAGYRYDDLVNFYAGPFRNYGEFDGTYEVVGVSSTKFQGTARNHGAVFGLEIGKPGALLMLEGVWNQTRSASSKESFWVGGISGVIGF